MSWGNFAHDIAGYELTAMGSPTGGANQKKVKRQFQDKSKAYYYLTTQNVQTDQPTSTHLLLGFEDMAERDGAALPENVAHGSLDEAKCVIEVLNEFGINVPIRNGLSTVKAWHDYSHGQRLDYRQDNHYIVLYVQKLGYHLINATWIKWSNWNPEDGRYLASSTNGDGGPGAVGHMIGITVDDGTKTITDTQELSPGTGRNPNNFDSFKLRYIFPVT